MMVEWSDCQPTALTWDELTWGEGDYWQSAYVYLHNDKLHFQRAVAAGARHDTYAVPVGTLWMALYADGQEDIHGRLVDPLEARCWLEAFQRGEIPVEEGA